MALNVKAWMQKITDKVVADGLANKIIMTQVAKRIVDDFNRIAMARLMERQMTESLTFTSSLDTGKKVITIHPSNPILFKKLEFGEFDENGAMKTPPHSIVQEWKVIVRL